MCHHLRGRNEVNVYRVTSGATVAVVLASDLAHAQSTLQRPNELTPLVEYIGLSALPAGILLATERKHYEY